MGFALIVCIVNTLIYNNMAFDLAFSTTDYNQGQSILINDESTDWANVPGGLVSVKFSITSLYDGVVLSVSPVVKTVLVGTTPFVEGFSYEITAVELGFGSGDTISDSIYNIVMTINDAGGVVVGSGNTYTSNEVVYYNAMYTRDNFIATKAAYLDEVYNKDMDYANWLDFLVTSIESNAVVGNTSAIFYIFDVFLRLDT
jgi:hypothetical protein